MGYYLTGDEVFDFCFAVDGTVTVTVTTRHWKETEAYGDTYVPVAHSEIEEVHYVVDAKPYSEKELVLAAPKLMKDFITRITKETASNNESR